MDNAGGRLVRPFSMIRGRVRPSQLDMDPFLMIVTRPGITDPQVPDREYSRILELCRDPLSVAEVAAYSGLPMTVAKVIISDLLDNGYLTPGSTAHERDPALLMLVREGLRRL